MPYPSLSPPRRSVRDTLPLDKRLQALSTEQAALKTALADVKATQAELAKLDTRIKALGGDIDALKKQGIMPVVIAGDDAYNMMKEDDEMYKALIADTMKK